MLREYELTLVARPDLLEADMQKLQAKYEQFMTNDGGQIIQKNLWGSRRLAFPIRKTYKAFYINYDYVGTRANVAEMERVMRFDESVLRFLSLKISDKVDVAKRREEIAKQANAMRELREREIREMNEEKEI